MSVRGDFVFISTGSKATAKQPALNFHYLLFCARVASPKGFQFQNDIVERFEEVIRLLEPLNLPSDAKGHLVAMRTGIQSYSEMLAENAQGLGNRC
jgi:hypothetical protein